MNDDEHIDNPAESNWLRGSKFIGFGLIFGGLLCSIIAALWFTGDFIATAVTSPNLSADTQVSDFNDFGYIGESLLASRFLVGSLVLVMSIAVIVQGLLLLSREGKAGTVFLAGGIAFAAQVLFLMQAFYWPVFVVFLLTAAGLYLATEWQRIQRTAEIHEQESTTFENQYALDDVPDVLTDPEIDVNWGLNSAASAPEFDATLENAAEMESSELDLIPTLVDEIETDDLRDDLTDQTFAREAAYLSGTSPEPDLQRDHELVSGSSETAEMFQPLATEPEPKSEQKIELPAFESTLDQEKQVEVEVEQPAAGRKKRVWNIVDWVISGLIMLVIAAIVLTIIAR